MEEYESYLHEEDCICCHYQQVFLLVEHSSCNKGTANHQSISSLTIPNLKQKRVRSKIVFPDISNQNISSTENISSLLRYYSRRRKIPNRHSRPKMMVFTCVMAGLLWNLTIGTHAFHPVHSKYYGSSKIGHGGCVMLAKISSTKEAIEQVQPLTSSTQERRPSVQKAWKEAQKKVALAKKGKLGELHDAFAKLDAKRKKEKAKQNTIKNKS
jgi:hypothetical protein